MSWGALRDMANIEVLELFVMIERVVQPGTVEGTMDGDLKQELMRRMKSSIIREIVKLRTKETDDPDSEPLKIYLKSTETHIEAEGGDSLQVHADLEEIQKHLTGAVTSECEDVKKGFNTRDIPSPRRVALDNVRKFFTREWNKLGNPGEIANDYNQEKTAQGKKIDFQVDTPEQSPRPEESQNLKKPDNIQKVPTVTDPRRQGNYGEGGTEEEKKYSLSELKEIYNRKTSRPVRDDMEKHLPTEIEQMVNTHWALETEKAQHRFELKVRGPPHKAVLDDSTKVLLEDLLAEAAKSASAEQHQEAILNRVKNKMIQSKTGFLKAMTPKDIERLIYAYKGDVSKEKTRWDNGLKLSVDTGDPAENEVRVVIYGTWAHRQKVAKTLVGLEFRPKPPPQKKKQDLHKNKGAPYQ